MKKRSTKTIPAEKVAKARKKINSESYDQIFGKNGALTAFTNALHVLTHNMEKYDDINERPLKTVEDVVRTIVHFKKENGRNIDYLKKNLDDQKKRAKAASLTYVLKEWLRAHGIMYTSRGISDYDGPIGDIITIHFHDRNVFRLNELKRQVDAFHRKQEKHGFDQENLNLDREVTSDYYALRPKVNQIRGAMTSMVAELKKINTTDKKKRYSLF